MCIINGHRCNRGNQTIYFGEGVVVQGYAYGGRLTGKEYRFWMAAETLEAFDELQILPADPRFHCKACEVSTHSTHGPCGI